MTLFYDKSNNQLTIKNYFNNADISKFEELRAVFNKYNCVEYTLKNIVLELDFSNKDVKYLFDEKLLLSLENKTNSDIDFDLRNKLYYLSIISETYFSATTSFQKEFENFDFLKNKNTTVFISFYENNKKVYYYIDLKDFIEKSKQVESMFKYLKVSTIKFVIETEIGIVVKNMFSDYDEYWTDVMETFMPYKNLTKKYEFPVE